MDVIVAFFSGVGAFIAGFFGHILAHDFCEVAPRLSKRLIQLAALRLPDEVRGRYYEEWLADLADTTSVFGKFRHALGCVVCVSRIRRELNDKAFPDFNALTIEVEATGTIRLNFATTMLMFETNASKMRSNLTALVEVLFALRRVERKYGCAHEINLQSIVDLLNIYAVAKKSEKSLTVRASVDGRTIFECALEDGKLIDIDSLRTPSG